MIIDDDDDDLNFKTKKIKRAIFFKNIDNRCHYSGGLFFFVVDKVGWSNKQKKNRKLN